MGYDITYHPITEEELKDWYFNRLNEISLSVDTRAKAFASEFKLDEYYTEKYMETLKAGAAGLKTNLGPFDKTHGFYCAVVQGFFRKFFYIRGASFSFFMEENISAEKYIKPWQEILESTPNCPVNNKITENYSSGVYIPKENLKAFYMDYNKNPKFREAVNGFYTEGRNKVFMKAVLYSIDNGLGLLEATEVITPNPLDLKKSESFTNLANCDEDGIVLYQKAAAEQLRQVQEKIQAEQAAQEDKKGILGKIKGLFKK